MAPESDRHQNPVHHHHRHHHRCRHHHKTDQQWKHGMEESGYNRGPRAASEPPDSAWRPTGRDHHRYSDHLEQLGGEPLRYKGRQAPWDVEAKAYNSVESRLATPRREFIAPYSVDTKFHSTPESRTDTPRRQAVDPWEVNGKPFNTQRSRSEAANQRGQRRARHSFSARVAEKTSAEQQDVTAPSTKSGTAGVCSRTINRKDKPKNTDCKLNIPEHHCAVFDGLENVQMGIMPTAAHSGEKQALIGQRNFDGTCEHSEGRRAIHCSDQVEAVLTPDDQEPICPAHTNRRMVQACWMHPTDPITHSVKCAEGGANWHLKGVKAEAEFSHLHSCIHVKTDPINHEGQGSYKEKQQFMRKARGQFAPYGDVGGDNESSASREPRDKWFTSTESVSGLSQSISSYSASSGGQSFPTQALPVDSKVERRPVDASSMSTVSQSSRSHSESSRRPRSHSFTSSSSVPISGSPSARGPMPQEAQAARQPGSPYSPQYQEHRMQRRASTGSLRSSASSASSVTSSVAARMRGPFASRKLR